MGNFFASCLIVANTSLLPWWGDDSIQLYERSIKDHIAGLTANTIHVLICEDLELSAKIGKTRVIQSEDARVLTKGRKSLFVMKVLPLQLSEGRIQVVIIDFIYTLKGTVPTLARAGAEVFRYQFDTASGTYLLLDREVGH
jgi:hypothetical protein